MSLSVKRSMVSMMTEVAAMLPDGAIKTSIETTINAKADNFAVIEEIFTHICSQKFPDDTMSIFLNGWKATHLKMLPIYGLSCRLNILGMEHEDDAIKLSYLQSSAFNAQTSHEDLGLGFDAVSHGKLYDDFAFSLVKSDTWKLSQYDTKEANDFSSWVYRSMLLNPIPYGLCINMFSEFYNHAEYAYSFETFKYAMEHFYGMDAKTLEDAVRYIDVHNQYETEIHHFMAVIHAIEKYEQASDETIGFDIINEVGNAYIDKITVALEAIAAKF